MEARRNYGKVSAIELGAVDAWRKAKGETDLLEIAYLRGVAAAMMVAAASSI